MNMAGQLGTIEIFLNFPVMDMNRNVLWNNPDKVDPSQKDRMSFFWGDENWHEAAYSKHQGLFDTIEEKNSNEVLLKHLGKDFKKWRVLSMFPVQFQ